METLSKQPMSPSPQTYVSRSPFFDVKPVAERIFEAKINDVFHYGYTIETSIEGKAFRGLLFSYKPEFSHAAHLYLTRKKLAAEQTASKPQNTTNENSPFVEQADRRVCFPVSAETCYLSSAEQGHSKPSEIVPPEQYQQELTSKQ
ncbi:hypothetical protein O6H91_22G025600 [Diphasiastrum complanatum]|uniref:Uncharacterized protein n=1 Tax=Diphasiastrum complanatum TaxID=34168 RepID=A0ACC2AFU3_DIPCM|nr:hypothetical protein O6H91_22G025600 [Diphasiastrum complanatum]